MKEHSLALAVAQSVEQQPWDDEPVIPTDDSAVLTTMLPLVALLVVYGAILLSSVRRSTCDSPMAQTLTLTRAP